MKLSPTDAQPFVVDDLTELPFGLPGKVFRGPLPYGPFDRRSIVLDRYRECQVDVVVQLVSDQEAQERIQRNLRQLYQDAGYAVIYLPTPDFGVPSLAQLQSGVQTALDKLAEGKNLVVHCNAGIGRTGLFLACLAQRGLGLTGGQAIRWIRKYIPEALEVPDQVSLAMDFGR